jgi:hypothetical protein
VNVAFILKSFAEAGDLEFGYVASQAYAMAKPQVHTVKSKR